MLSWKGFKYVAKAPKVIYSYMQVILICLSVCCLGYYFAGWVAMLKHDF